MNARLNLSVSKQHLSNLGSRVMQGDLQAEQELMKHCFPMVLSFLAKKSSNKLLVEDATQEKMIVVIKSLRVSKIKDIACLQSYIYSVAWNQFIMVKRVESKQPESTLEVAMEREVDQRYTMNVESIDIIDSIMKSFSRLSRERDKDILIKFCCTPASKLDLLNAYQLKAPHFDRVLYRARNRFKVAWDAVCGN